MNYYKDNEYYSVFINEKSEPSIEKCDSVISFNGKKCIFKNSNYIGIKDYDEDDDDDVYVVVLWSNISECTPTVNINIYLEKKHYISGFDLSDANILLQKIQDIKKLN
jgi:hypothetical protein